MKKKASGMPLEMIVAAVLLLALLVAVIWFQKDSFTKTKNTLDPITLKIKADSCSLNSKGINDYDQDGLDNYCDPCIDGKDGGTNDKNGNYMSDACEGPTSTSKKIVCKFELKKNGKILGNIQCCSNVIPQVTLTQQLGSPDYACIKVN